MVVGDDIAGLVDDEAGAGADRLVRLLAAGRWPNWLKKSRNGAGILSAVARHRRWSWFRTVMVTTAGLTRSTRSAKLKGALFSSMRGARESRVVGGEHGSARCRRSGWRGPAAAARRRPGRPPRWRRRCPSPDGAGAACGLGRRDGRLLGVRIVGLHHALLEAGAVRPEPMVMIYALIIAEIL